jgi:hypothetical protein
MNQDFEQQLVNGWPQVKLDRVDELIHQRKGRELGDMPASVPMSPVTGSLGDYLAGLGDGTRVFEGLRTGIDTVDHLIGGLNRFVLMAGIGGAGKSTLAIQMGLGVIRHEHVPVIYYSYEMDGRDVTTLLLQNIAAAPGGSDTSLRLDRTELLLRGNSPGLGATIKTTIGIAQGRLTAIGGMFYIVEAGKHGLRLADMEAQISEVMARHEVTNCLVIVDSIQDLIEPGQAQTTAEATCAQQIVELQQATGATFLAISQKSKSGAKEGGYGSVLGSVAMVHKPTTVVELTSTKEAIGRVRSADTATAFRRLSDQSDVGQPVFMTVLKGRNNGYGVTALAYYGKWRYFTEERTHDYEVGEQSLYEVMGL